MKGSGCDSAFCLISASRNRRVKSSYFKTEICQLRTAAAAGIGRNRVWSEIPADLPQLRCSLHGIINSDVSRQLCCSYPVLVVAIKMASSKLGRNSYARGARPDKHIVESFSDMSYMAYVRTTPRPFMQFVSGHFPQNTRTRPHSHPCIALHGCLQGPLLLATDRGDQLLDAGGFCLIAPDVRHHWRNQGDHTGATLGLLIDADHPGQWPAGAGVEECCQKLTRLVQGVHRFNMTREDELRHSFWLAADHLTSVQPRNSVSIIGALLTLLGHCIEQLEGKPAEVAPANDVAQQIRRILLSRVGERLSINEISKELAVSPTRAKEAFRKAFGSGIVAYHNQLKIWQAKRLLCDPALTVEQISRRLGFSSPSYFSQMFSQHTGESPTEFRHRNAT